MTVIVQAAPMTVADYCKAMSRGEILSNPDYQRSDKVWPPAARSFLIETILQGYPIPKFYLYQVTDLKSKATKKEIVDGQQRSRAILAFYNNEFAVGKKSEIEGAGGKKYDQLSEELQAQFLGYSLSIDLFISATPDHIRESFRRLNSYTVPLNPEEKRNAQFQGPFKWFVYQFCRDYADFFIASGVFSVKQIVRMQDTKLVSEVVDALVNGITTTNSKKLDKLYEHFDKQFDQISALDLLLHEAMTFVTTMPELFSTHLTRPHVFYSLLLACIHRRNIIPTLQSVYSATPGYQFDRQLVLSNLTRLAASLDEDDPSASEFPDFATASKAKTNVAVTRQERFKWLCRALEPVAL